MRVILFGIVAAIAGIAALASKAGASEAEPSSPKPRAGGNGRTPATPSVPGVPPGITPGADERPTPGSPEAPATPAEASLPTRPSPLPGKPPPPLAKARTVEERVVAALASGDPAVMRAVAGELEREGAHMAAKGLRDAAAFAEAGVNPIPNPGSPERVSPPPPIATSPGIVPRPAPTPVLAPTPTPIELPEMVVTPVPEDPIRLKAAQLTTYLKSIGGLAGRYKENRALVKEYQLAESLTADGKYGPGTATKVLGHGLVPVAPYYWTTAGPTAVSRQKQTFIAAVRKAQSLDPSRTAEYDALIRDTQRS